MKLNPDVVFFDMHQMALRLCSCNELLCAWKQKQPTVIRMQVWADMSCYSTHNQDQYRDQATSGVELLMWVPMLLAFARRTSYTWFLRCTIKAMCKYSEHIHLFHQYVFVLPPSTFYCCMLHWHCNAASWHDLRIIIIAQHRSIHAIVCPDVLLFFV